MSTKLKHAELLQSQTNAGDQIKVDSSEIEELFNQEKIPGTPFTVIIWKEEKQFAIGWGRFRITEDKISVDYVPTIEDAIHWLDSNIVNVMVIVSTIVVQHNITEALINTQKSIEEELKKQDTKTN